MLVPDALLISYQFSGKTAEFYFALYYYRYFSVIITDPDMEFPFSVEYALGFKEVL